MWDEFKFKPGDLVRIKGSHSTLCVGSQLLEKRDFGGGVARSYQLACELMGRVILSIIGEELLEPAPPEWKPK